MSVLKFNEMTDEWLDFIARCRNGEIHQYDIVEGPMANDTIWNYVNDFLSFEQVSDEIIEQYKIEEGDFDTIMECKYTVPGFQDIGKLYCIMIEDCAESGKEVDELINIFSSFISDFQTDIYYRNPSYLECSYRAGYLLD